MRSRVVVLGLCFLASLLSAQTPGRRLTDAQWREDLDFMHRTMVADHKNVYHTVTPQQLDEAFAALERDLPRLSDAQITVRVIGIGALVHDGHSRVDVDSRAGLSHVGLWLVSYPDGLFVREASPENKALLGARVERIGNVSADEALSRVRSLVSCDPNNDGRLQSWPLSMFLADPLVLNGLGLSASPEEATYTLSVNGHTSSVTLKPTANRQDLYPFRKGWLHAVGQRGEQPLANPWAQYIAFAEVPAAHAIYLQFNSVYSPPGQTMAQFVDGLAQFIATHDDDRLVIDLRRNPGGDNTNLRPLLIAIARSRFNHRGHLFVLIGPVTFSAAQNFTNRLENVTEAIFVGQPSGNNVNFYGDTTAFGLPNSHITVKMSYLWWQDKDPTDSRTATFPEIAIPQDSFADALGGKDAALHYALYSPTPPRLEDLMAAAAEQGYDQALAALKAYSAEPQHRYSEGFEDRLNTVAACLAQSGKMQAAVAVLQVNADTHPSSWQTLEYLGEGYAAVHDNTRALEAFRRSHELNPSNTAVQHEIEQLQRAH